MLLNITPFKQKAVLAVGITLMVGCGVKATPYLWRSYFSEMTSYYSYQVKLNSQGETYDLANSQLRKLSPHGEELWRYNLGDGRLDLYGNDGAILSGHPISRISSAGDELWKQDLLPSGSRVGDVAVAANGQIFTTYYYYSYPAGYGDTGIVAMDTEGNPIWSYALSHSDNVNRNRMNSVIPLSSGNVLTVTSGLGLFETHLFDADGNLLQTHKFENENYQGAFVYRDADNIFVLSNGNLFRLNPDGTQQWTYGFGRSVSCSKPVGAEIACVYNASELANTVSRVTWLNADGSLRTTATVDTYGGRGLTYAGSNKWILNDFVEPAKLGSNNAQPPLGFPSLSYTNTPGVAYPLLTVLDYSGAVVKKITLQPSNMTPTGCIGAFCAGMAYSSDGDGPVSVLANDTTVYAIGKTTMTQKDFISTYPLN